MEPIRTIPDTVPAPNRTLGDIAIRWCTRYLRQPDGPDAGDPWRFTREQARTVMRFYELDDNGSFVYRQGTVRRIKGAGKDPFAAALCAFEFVGPCRFSHWDASGNPVGISHPAAWVQVAATSKDQAQNTMALFPGMFSNDALSAYGIDLGKEIIYSGVGGRIEAVTASARALEGRRATFTLMNETQHWVKSNGGHHMAMTIAGNVAKSRGGGARTLEITNAPLPGEDSVAERTYHAWSKLRDISPDTPRLAGFYYDSIEAPASVVLGDRDSLRAGIIAARGDADWLDVDWIISTIYSGTYPAYQSRRMFLNQLVVDEDSLIDPQDWDALTVSDRLADGDRITLGFDGGKTNDATALIAMRVSDRLIEPLGIWEKPDGPAGENWEVDREAVEGAVHHAFERFDVAAFFADPVQWDGHVARWSEEYRDRFAVRASTGSAVARRMDGSGGQLRELTDANARLVAAIENGHVRHIGNETLRRHVMNAKRWPNRYGVSFRKENPNSRKKVDGYAALLLADLARTRLVEAGKLEMEQRDGRMFFG
ncbi:terminase [Streptomyces sp. NPDC102402]|uniref:terminase n=1 Tax=Streptomyces sp. NPDC102402 TaxID=3366169 RepID=UPI003813BCFB